MIMMKTAQMHFSLTLYVLLTLTFRLENIPKVNEEVNLINMENLINKGIQDYFNF
jgi:hypothetical protein